MLFSGTLHSVGYIFPFSLAFHLDTVPEELWTEVNDTVQEAGIKTIPQKKKCKKAKRLSDEALHIAEKRKQAKGKGEKKDIPI